MISFAVVCIKFSDSRRCLPPILLSHLFLYLSTPSRFFYIFPRLAKERKHVSRKSRKLARYFCRRKRSTYKIRNYADTTMVDYSCMHLTIMRRKLAQTNKSRHVCLSQCNLCKIIFIKKLIISETHISGEKNLFHTVTWSFPSSHLSLLSLLMIIMFETKYIRQYSRQN